MCERLFAVANSTNADIVSCNYYIYREDDDKYTYYVCSR